LVEKGASMQVRDRGGETVLHEACSYKCPSALLEYYIEHAKVDVNSRDKQHWTPLHNWVFNIYYACLKKALPDMQKKLAVLIAAGARLDLKDAQERTPLDILIAKRDDRYSSKDDVAAYDTLIAQYREAMAKSDVNHNNQ
jgi:ankyrin repeat protein